MTKYVRAARPFEMDFNTSICIRRYPLWYKKNWCFCDGLVGWGLTRMVRRTSILVFRVVPRVRRTSILVFTEHGNIKIVSFQFLSIVSCDGRVVKAPDFKSESCEFDSHFSYLILCLIVQGCPKKNIPLRK